MKKTTSQLYLDSYTETNAMVEDFKKNNPEPTKEQVADLYKRISETLVAKMSVDPKLNKLFKMSDEDHINEAKSNYDKTMVALIRGKTFFGYLLATFRPEFTVSKATMPTLGVSIVNNKIKMGVDAFCFNAMTPAERMGVLEHEMAHIIGDHIRRFYEFKKTNGKKTSFKKMNMAADYSIDQSIGGLPHYMLLKLRGGNYVMAKGLDFDTDIKATLPDVRSHAHTEYYYEVLDKMSDEEKQKAFGNDPFGGGDGSGEPQELTMEELEELMNSGELDVHEEWQKGETDIDVIDQVVGRSLKNASDKTKTYNGTVPGQVQDILKRIFESKVNWRSQLQNFFASCKKVDTRSTRVKRNRRYGLMQPGKKRKERLNLVVATDVSGSVPDDAIQQFFGEIKKIHALGHDITVLIGDAQVNNVVKYNPKKPIDFKGRGGTAYKPFFEYTSKMKDVDALIVFGDMETWNEEIMKPKFPVLWGIVGRHEPPGKFGRKIYITVNE